MVESEKPTREGKYLKGIAYAEMIAGVGLIFLYTPMVVGLLILGSGGFKYALIRRAERDKK